MKKFQLSLGSLLLLCAAAPIWIFLIVIVSQSTGWGGNSTRFYMAPLVLTGITAAVHRLLRDHRNAWALAFLAAAVIALGSLSLAAWMAG